MSATNAGASTTTGPLELPASPAPIAAVDVGSNTVHVTVARRLDDGTRLGGLEIIADQSDLVRLGHDVAATGRLGPERTTRALAALRQYAALARMLGAEIVLGMATEGVRTAANCGTFVARAAAETGIPLHVIAGDQEAALSYWGATSQSAAESAVPRGPRAVVDLGGGSLELVIGEGTAVRWRVSLPLGAGAVRDRYGLSNPPTLGELDRAYQAVHALLASYAPPLPVDEFAVCGGTAGALAVLGTRVLGEGGPRIIVREGHLVEVTGPPILTRYHLEAVLALLHREPAARVAARHGIRPARARILSAGCIVLLATMERLGVSRLRVSARGLREGAILAYLHAGDAWLAAAARGTGWD
jgi:exopolyphosphatase/guanosine-5'-triphosphate,3'-diphosphate pyrophosphatase